MEDEILYWIMEKHAQSKKDTQPLPSAWAKKTREVKHAQLLDVLIHFTTVKAQLLAYIFQVSLIALIY